MDTTSFIAVPPRRPRRRKTIATPTPTPSGPVLTEADFNADGLTLYFDRDVNVDAFAGNAIVVNDPSSESSYVGTGASIVSGFIVQVYVDSNGPSAGTQATLTATAANGIVAADTGAAWAGVSGFALTE